MRFLIVLSLFAGLTGLSGAQAQALAAGPPCQVRLSVRLDDYVVNRGAAGLISVQVTCPDSGQYVLGLYSRGLPMTGPQATLRLDPLTGEGAPAQVVVNGMPLPGTFNGTRHFDLQLWAAPGQWGLSGGTYQVPIAVEVTNPVSGDMP